MLKMRIIIIGIALLVIWCFVSAWLFNDKLVPAMKKPLSELIIPETQTNEADSLMKLKASMPVNLLIYFDFDKAKFKTDPQNDSKVVSFKLWLDKYSGSMLTVTGHTDLVGSIDYNYNLGLKRALTVEKYLEDQGVNASRMVVSSKGETEPAADYITQEGRAKNRRTEISLKMQ
jgi:outer membrane protein OmpA-like peptidoglycan-associated protein